MNYAWFKVVNHKYSLYNDVLINSLNIKIALLLKFPNLIFSDNTWGLNENDYPMWVLAGQDNNRTTYPIAVSVMAYERKVFFAKKVKIKISKKW